MKKSIIQIFSALLAVALSTVSAFAATTYYWDNNGTTAGFGTAGGTWAAPTTGSSSQGWSTDSTGATLPGSVTTATTDTINFGITAVGLASGTVAVSGTVSAGNITFASGSGAINLSGGTLTLAASQTMQVDNAADTIGSAIGGAGTTISKTGTGNLSLGGGGSISGNLTVNNGTVSITSGTFTTTSFSFIGKTASQSGVVSVSSGATLNFNHVNGGGLGYVSAASGALYNSGTFSATQFYMSDTLNNGSYGYVRNAGTMSSGNTLAIARGNNASVVDVVGGGATTVTPTANGGLTLASGASATAGLNITGGGTFTDSRSGAQEYINGGGSSDYTSINISGTGSKLTMTGDAGFDMNHNGNGGDIDTITLNNGGEFDNAYLYRTTGGVNIFNFNGGTYKATAADGGGIIQAGISAYVHSGGATIDNNSLAINLPVALQAPSGNGVTAIALPGGNPITGYIGAPIVKITDSTGTGAAAIATFDPATGSVTGFTITSPGTGYSSSPTITLVGGRGGSTGSTASTVASGNITVGSVTSGGVTFQGSGTTTNKAANSYSGGTIINAGTVALSGSGTLGSAANALTINGGILDLGALTTPTAGAVTISGGTIQNGTLTASTSYTANNSGAATVSAKLAGSVALTMSGTGKLTLSGANTYSGDTTISGGTLAMSGSGSLASANITVNSGKIFDVSGVTGGYTVAASQSLVGSGVVTGAVTIASSTSAITPGGVGGGGTLSLSNNLTMTSGGLAYFDVSTTASSGNDQIIVAGNLALSSSDTVHISALGGAANLDTNANYVLFSVSGTTTMSTTPVLAWDGTKPANYLNYSIQKVGQNVVLQYTSATAPTVTATSTPATVARGQAITVTATVTPGSPGSVTNVQLNASAIGGSSTANLVLSATANVYTNTFIVASSAALGVVMMPVVAMDNTPLTSPAYNVTNTIVATNEVWNGVGGDNKWSTGANWVSGYQPGAGDSTTLAGTTRLTNNLDASLSLGSLTFDNTAGSFDITNAADTLTLTAGLTNNSANAQTLDVPVVLSGAQTISAAAGNVTVNRPVSDSGAGFTLAGSGMLTLSGVNTYSGATTISGGLLTITNSGSLGSGSYSANITNNGALNYGSSANQTLSGIISGTGSLTNAGSGTVTLNGANTYSGGTTLNAGTLSVGASSTPTSGAVTSGPLGTGTLTLHGGGFNFTGGAFTLANNVNVTGATAIAVANGLDEVLNGNFSGNGNLTLVTPGSTTAQWQFGGDNSGYSGTFTQNSGNTSLAFNSANSGSASAAWVFNNALNQRTRLNFGAGTISFGSLSGNGSIANIAASGAATVSVGALNSSTSFTGVLGGSTTGQGQNISLLNVGTGMLTLSGVNTYTGTTTISGGTLALSGSGSIANSANIILAGATFDVSGLSSTFTMGSGKVLTGGGGAIAGSVSLNAGSLVLNYTNGTPSLSVTNGALSFNSNAVTVTVSGGALGVGSYKLIAKNTGGSVNGTLPVNVTVNGAGATAPVALQLVSGELYLVVGATTTTLVSSENSSGFKDSVTFTASVQTNGVTAGNATGTVTFYTNSVAYATNGLSSGSTNISLSVLPRGTNLITVIYSGNVNYQPSTNSLNQVVTNHPPVAGNATCTRNAGIYGLRITISDLLTNVTDVDGDSITLVGVGTSTNGVIVSLSGTNLLNYYNTNNVNDQFSYTVTDGFGGTNSGLVSIVVSNAVVGQITGQFTSFTGGVANLTFHGIPNYSYITERSTNLTDWVDVVTNSAATNGVISVTDSFGDLGNLPPASAYYRLKWQP